MRRISGEYQEGISGEEGCNGSTWWLIHGWWMAVEGRKRSCNHAACSDAAIQPYSQTARQPYSQTAIQPYSHTAIQPYSHTAIQPYIQAAIQPYSHTAIQPFYAAIPVALQAAIPAAFVCCRPASRPVALTPASPGLTAEGSSHTPLVTRCGGGTRGPERCGCSQSMRWTGRAMPPHHHWKIPIRAKPGSKDR